MRPLRLPEIEPAVPAKLVVMRGKYHAIIANIGLRAAGGEKR